MNGLDRVRSRTVAITFFVCFVFATAAPLVAAKTFAEANALYRDGDYAAAIEAYESVLKAEKDTAVLYNLGNAYFKQFQLAPNQSAGLLGKAILSYERVLRADPRHSDARANLKYARTLCKDTFEAPSDGAITALLSRVYRAPTTMELEIFAVICLWILAFVLLLRRHVRRETTAELLFWVLFLVVPITVLALAWAGRRAYEDETQRAGIILVAEVQAKSAPQEDGTHVFTLHEGTKIIVVRSSVGWVQISLPNGYAGWVRSEALGLVD